MSKMQELIAQRKNLQEGVDEYESQQNALVQRVLRIFDKVDFGWTKPDYHSGSPNHELLGNHLWPQHFATFEVYDGELHAQGMYSGSHGYYEPESVRFPAAWLDLNDDDLIAAILAAWQAHNQKLDLEKMALDRRVEAKERAELARLQEKFGSQEKSG